MKIQSDTGREVTAQMDQICFCFDVILHMTFKSVLESKALQNKNKFVKIPSLFFKNKIVWRHK